MRITKINDKSLKMLLYIQSMDYYLNFLQVITFYPYLHKIWRSFIQTAKKYWYHRNLCQLHHKKHIFSNLTLTLLIAEVERFMAVRVGDFSSRRIGGPLDFLSSISLWIRSDSCASSSLLNLASLPSGWAFLVTGLQTNQSSLISVNYSCCNKSILIDTVVYILWIKL